MNTPPSTYYALMDSAIDDKLRLLDWANPGSLLEVGFGSGALLSRAANNYDVVGVDPVAGYIDPSVETHKLYADELEQIGKKFDTVVFCSSMHEIFSYGNRSGTVGKLTSISDALKSAYNVLKPGGRLIIRDGVASGHIPRGRLSGPGVDLYIEFINHSVFGHNGLDNTYDRRLLLSLDCIAGVDYIRGSVNDLAEYAYTVVWGADAIEREAQEYYRIFDLGEYSRFVCRRGFNLIHSEKYVQPGYIHHLNGFLTLTRRGKEIEWPATNAIWVYEKL